MDGGDLERVDRFPKNYGHRRRRLLCSSVCLSAITDSFFGGGGLAAVEE